MTIDKMGLTRREVLRVAGCATASAAMSAPTFAAVQDSARTIGMALVGGAHIHTPQYVNALKSRQSVRVKAVWDHDSARAQRWAKELGCKTAELKEIWTDPEITAVAICSETNRHHDLVLAAAQA